MKTAYSIEQNKADDISAENPQKFKQGKNPNSLANLCAPWTSETRPKSPGRPKDTAADISRKVFENNEEAIYQKAFEQVVSTPFGFSVHADRAYGKMKQGIIHTGDEEGGPIRASLKVEFVEPEKSA